jgi:hypothetical protein
VFNNTALINLSRAQNARIYSGGKIETRYASLPCPVVRAGRNYVPGRLPQKASTATATTPAATGCADGVTHRQP